MYSSSKTKTKLTKIKGETKLKTPLTVLSRYQTLTKRLNPNLSAEEATSISNKLWYVVEFFGSGHLREDIDIQDEFTVALELAKVDGDVVGYCTKLKPKRTLSAETKMKRIRAKIAQLASENGIDIEIKGE